MNLKSVYHCFESGDLCRNQQGELAVIIKIEKGEYEFINLQSKTINVIGNILRVEKGSISKQVCSVFDKYNYLYQAK